MTRWTEPAQRAPPAFLARQTGWRADLCALALGMLSAAALPPVYALPVLLVSVPGLLALIDGARGIGDAFRRAWAFSFGSHLLGLYWITEAILFEAARLWWAVPLAVPALAALLAAFVAAPVCLVKLVPRGWPRALGLAGAWVLGDIARQFVATGFPWNPWGSVWEFPGAAGDVFIQIAAYVGVHGMTWATLVLAALPTLGWRSRAGGAVAVAAWAAFGQWRLDQAPPPAPGVKVALVQGYVPQATKWDRGLAIDHFRRYLDLTARASSEAGPGPAVIVWPESASPFLLAEDAAARAAVVHAAGGRTVLAGSVRYDADRRPRNSLLEILADGSVAGFYDKWHLVPFGEFQPSWFPLPMQVVPGGGFAAGDGPKTLTFPDAPPAGALICYEAIYSAETVDEARRPDWLVNVTNDAWFGNSSGPRQHLAGVRLRAAEEGLPLMRAANTGITAAFDAFGRELARLPADRADVLIVELPGALPPTLYAATGLAAPSTIAAASVAFAVWRTGYAHMRRPPGRKKRSMRAFRSFFDIRAGE